jgi:hypothetical protein
MKSRRKRIYVDGVRYRVVDTIYTPGMLEFYVRTKDGDNSVIKDGCRWRFCTAHDRIGAKA